MTRRLDQRGAYGCIARARARTRCASLVCARDNLKYWCNCYNSSCAALRTPDAPAAKLGPLEAKGAVPPKERMQLLRAVRRDARTMCVDVNASTQLLLRSGGMGAAACPWSKAELLSRQQRYRFVERASNCSVVAMAKGQR